MASRRWLVVPVVVGVYAAVLGGCSGAGGGGGSSTSVRVSSSVVSSSPVVVTSSGAVGDGRPAAARAHTQAGAEAFLRFFFDQLNVAWTKPDAHALDGLCLASSKSCADYRRTAQEFVRKGQHFDRPPVDPTSIVATLTSGSVWRYQVELAKVSARIVDDHGSPVSTDPGEALVIGTYLGWSDGAWIAHDFKVVPNG